MFVALLLAITSASPAPAATPALEEIIRVKSSPLCSTVQSTVLYTIQGLQADDDLIEGSKPVLLVMGKDFATSSTSDEAFVQKTAAISPTVAGGTHDPSPALVLSNIRLQALITQIVHNLGIIDNLLNDPTRFPAVAKTDEDKKALLLKAQLQSIADKQRKNLNVLSGLAETLSLQSLTAAGDGTQGVTNDAPPVPGSAKGKSNSQMAYQQISYNDQDVSFQDVVSGADRGRATSPVNPTVDQDPAIFVSPSDLANNPMSRFYNGVAGIQASTGIAEKELSQTVVDVVEGCRKMSAEP
jgi:hypothetical protein